MIKIKQIVTWFFVIPLFIGVASAADAPAEWAVKDATIRYVVELATEPTHPSAGFFVRIPDGGVLPGPNPESVVVDKAGNPLKSGILWHCRDTECSLVFEAPASGESVTIYFRGARKSNLWTPESGLTPGALLCEQSGTRSKSAAQKLGNLGAVDAKVRFVNQGWDAGSWKGQSLPLATWEWRLGGNAVYILSYIDVKYPGNIWIAPFSRSGQMDIFIDGSEVKQKKKSEKVGGIGGSVNLTKGLHRVELYGYDVKDKATGPMMFTWRTSKTTDEELGGLREKEHRYPGTPMNESCVIDAKDVVKSGECRVVDVGARSGPVAAFTYKPKSTFWLGNEEPLISYYFKSLAESSSEDTRYSWRFQREPEAVSEGAETTWLIRAGTFTKVTLTAEQGRNSSTATYVIYPHTDIESSMEDAHTRQDFKLACYNMLKAYPARVDPTGGWGDAMWNNFFRVLEIQGSNALLEYIVTQQWDFFKKKLEPEKKALIQDIFLFSLASRNPKEAFKWAGTFASEEFTSARAAVLKLKKAEILMYYLDDIDAAKRVVVPLLSTTGDGGEWAKIRMGDIEFLDRNLNAATQRYGDVQSRAKALAETVVPKRLLPIPSGPTRSHDKPDEPAAVAVMGKKTRRNKKDDANEVENKYVPMTAPSAVPAWKLAAVRDVAASENISVLIDQGYYLEAFRSLSLWERAFPMSKISGDFILRESRFYMELGDFKRARKMLTAYCEQVDVSNFLPEAMDMVRRCMIEMKEPDSAIQQYEKEILKRTVFGANEE